jgi:hypothetical protein
MLHAAHLAFAHPVTGAKVAVDSPLPADFARVLAKLRSQTPRGEKPSRPRRARRPLTRKSAR